MDIMSLEDFFGPIRSEEEYLALEGQVLDVAILATPKARDWLKGLGGACAFVDHKVGAYDSSFLSQRGLTRVEIGTIIMHEKGHLVHGVDEFLADEYATKNSSASALISALEKVTVGEDTESLVYSEYRERLKRLRALCN